MKWGEYSSDVHFILQRTALDTNKSNVSANNNANKSVTRPKTIDPLHGFTPPLPPPPPPPTGPAPETNWPSPSCKELKKTPTFSGRLPVPESGGEAPATTPSAPERKVNVVRGVPQQHDYSASQNGGSSLNSSFDQDKAFHFIVAGGLQDSRDSSCSVDGSYHSLSTGSALRYESPSAKRTVVDGINDSNLYSTAQYCLPSPSTPSEPIYARYDQPRCAVSAGEESPRAPPPYRNPPPPMTGNLRLMLYDACDCIYRFRVYLLLSFLVYFYFTPVKVRGIRFRRHTENHRALEVRRHTVRVPDRVAVHCQHRWQRFLARSPLVKVTRGLRPSGMIYRRTLHDKFPTLFRRSDKLRRMPPTMAMYLSLRSAANRSAIFHR